MLAAFAALSDSITASSDTKPFVDLLILLALSREGVLLLKRESNPNGIYTNRILFFLDLYFHRFT